MLRENEMLKMAEQMEEQIEAALKDNYTELSEHWADYLEDNISDDETWLVEAECLKNVRNRLFEIKRIVEDIKEQVQRLNNIVDYEMSKSEEEK